MPGVLNVNANDEPTFNVPESQIPVSEVDVCCTLPLLVQRTVSPVTTFTGSGSYRKSSIETLTIACTASGPCAVAQTADCRRTSIAPISATKPTVNRCRGDTG